MLCRSQGRDTTPYGRGIRTRRPVCYWRRYPNPRVKNATDITMNKWETLVEAARVSPTSGTVYCSSDIYLKPHVQCNFRLPGNA